MKQYQTIYLKRNLIRKSQDNCVSRSSSVKPTEKIPSATLANTRKIVIRHFSTVIISSKQIFYYKRLLPSSPG